MKYRHSLFLIQHDVDHLNDLDPVPNVDRVAQQHIGSHITVFSDLLSDRILDTKASLSAMFSP